MASSSSSSSRLSFHGQPPLLTGFLEMEEEGATPLEQSTSTTQSPRIMAQAWMSRTSDLLSHVNVRQKRTAIAALASVLLMATTMTMEMATTEVHPGGTPDARSSLLWSNPTALAAVENENDPSSLSSERMVIEDGGTDGDADTDADRPFPLTPQKLFYCGGSWGNVPKEDRENGVTPKYGYPTIARRVFPNLFTRPEEDDAIPLTEQTLPTATEDDLLIYQMHQWCEVDINHFPGKQIHLNSEYYDLHPKNKVNQASEGALTLDYIPPYARTYMLGPHPDSDRSIRVTYVQLLFNTLPPGQKPVIMDPNKRPRNTRKHFLLYSNSHYILYREQAALALSQIGTIHTLGWCQGNSILGAPAVDDWETKSTYQRCVPWPEADRPKSIQPMQGNQRANAGRFNMEILKDYRFALVMENINSPGYVSEKILGAFLGGAIPIYYGTPEVLDIFNPDAFVYYDPTDPQPALDRITHLERNADAYEKALSAPILRDGEHTLARYFSFQDDIGGGELKKRIWDMVGYDGVSFSREPLRFRMIQASPPRTGSTVVTNMLIGLFEASSGRTGHFRESAAHICYQQPLAQDDCPANHVVKMHLPAGKAGGARIDGIGQWFRNETGTSNVFFVSTNRGDQRIADDYCNDEVKHPNVLCFEYEDVALYKNEEEMAASVRKVMRGIRDKFPFFDGYVFNMPAAMQRLRALGEVTKSLSKEPFEVWDSKHGVHGGHNDENIPYPW